MARRTLACVVALVALSAAKEQTRWSRQISSYTSDLSDWVPLPGPIERQLPSTSIKRQAVAEPRILAEPVFPGFQRPTGFSQDIPSRNYFNHPVNRQLYLQSVPAVPSAPQNYLSDSGFNQGLRFGLSQPNFPLNQGFVSPQLTFEAPPLPSKPRTSLPFISNPIAFPKSNLSPHQVKPFINQAPKKIEQKTVDGYRIENVASFQSMKKPQSLQKLKYETYDKVPKQEMTPPKAKSEREEVQLLYVPLESLNKGQFNLKSPLAAPQTQKGSAQRAVVNPIPAPPKQSYSNDLHRPAANQPIDAFEMDFLTNFNTQYKEFDQVPKYSTISTPFPTTLPTTPRPKKLKPHQPPLAIFLAQDTNKRKQAKVSDVLTSLKNADSVAVLDSVNPQTAPKVFIGPSNLAPPENFVKFELPYLSNIDHSDRKLRQLPFFVAPLSYNTPQGFAKIPFPSPHVGSVIINAQQIKDAPQQSLSADVIPNSYSTPPQQYIAQQEQKPITQKPLVSFYSTSPPRTNAPPLHQANYYTIEPQTVSTIRPPKEPQASIVTGPPKQPGSYFLSNFQDQQNVQQVGSFEVPNHYQSYPPIKGYNGNTKTDPTTQRTTISSTTPKPSTYPNQLLETHNPYSINQAFHFSTPLDYHNLFEENYATPGYPKQSELPPRDQQSTVVSTPASATPSASPKPIEPVTEKVYQTSPNYLQNNYSPEIHYESELANTRYQVSNDNQYTTKSEANEYSQSSPQEDITYSVSSAVPPSEYTVNTESQPVSADQNEAINTAPVENDAASKSSSPYYNQYETSYEASREPSSTSSTTTTTTRRTPVNRNRGRPRYTTPKADSNESTARTVVTRKPLRERRPLPSRNRYEPNKITTERATRKPVDSNENTTKYTRSRTRGRVQYKPTESDEYYKSSKVGSSKENDLAYQRDVLHQNYPVTLMERSSTHDIEAITEPIPRISSTKVLESVTEVYDTENAYSYDRAAVSQHVPYSSSKEESDVTRTETRTETYIPKYSSTREDYTYQSRSSLAPVEAISQYEESSEREDFGKPTTVSFKSEITEPSVSVTEQSPSSFSISDFSAKSEEPATTTEVEITKLSSQETTLADVPEENLIQTTPSYNRVRVRPGVVRQYHQASSTESSRATRTRRPVQAVTYRPAYSGRRTTMRIEEIEADLKTKPLHSRPEQDYRHPVYRPEPTTEPAATSSSSQEATTKRGVFRRRRPTYTTTTTSTEATGASATTKRTYEVKNRFRGRRPTDKPTTERPEVQTDSTTTVRSTIYSRYTRPRLSERYNKKPEPQDSEDQDSNYSIHRPKYAEPETEQWSPKISTDSFKPYNPNEIADDRKSTLVTAPPSGDEQDIITAKSDDCSNDCLLTVTPASNNNNRVNKKIPDIPPTLEAFVEQSKTTSADNNTRMSTFETMLEEVMKSLEEQDENEYTSKVMKHKGGEIGEIPPERIITSGDKFLSIEEQAVDATTAAMTTAADSSAKKEEKEPKPRRGFWKKVKVRPVTTESIEAAESQYYPSAVNQLGQNVPLAKAVHEKAATNDKPVTNDKPKITTYKPSWDFLQSMFGEDQDEIYPVVDIPKIPKTEKSENKTTHFDQSQETFVRETTKASTSTSPGNIDLGTGSPDPTIDDLYTTTTSEATTLPNNKEEKHEGFSFMDYLFGTTEDDIFKAVEKSNEAPTSTEESKAGPTTESTYIPDEITITTKTDDDIIETPGTEYESKKLSTDNSGDATQKYIQSESSTVSSYMDPGNVMSTSMSTEVSHETEICFRGKCIKTSEDVL